MTKQNKNPFSQMEEQVLDFWEEANTFEKSIINPGKNEQNAKDYVFYDGPPFITGLPHYATLLPSIAKDVVPRYWTMKGYRVKRVWGWDCHGLPAENKVEKQLKLRNKKDIEVLGVDKFIDACQSYVSEGSKQWEWYIKRIARWVDMKNAYKTMDLSFMESVMWAFKQLYDKNLIYEGYRSSLHCPRCATPLSKFEITMDAGSYKDVSDQSVIVKFKVKNQDNTYLLAWTTTPWTLPGNLALAIGGDIEYVLVKHNQESFILAQERLEEIFKDKDHEVVKKINSKDLIGLKYEPVFDLNNLEINQNKNVFKVYDGDFVNTEEGTGIVHIAPNFGEDDFNLGQKNNLPIIELMDENGIYTKEAGEEFENQYFKKAGKKVLEILGKNLFAEFEHTHSYPFCYRCDTSLIYKTQKAWYLRISEIRNKMLETNQKINWLPDYFRDGRFKNNLETAPDWCLSRSRYWGSPVPVWKCNDCDEIKVIGSLDELKKNSQQRITKIIFVRHGESQKNVLNINSSEVDKFPLTQKGENQVSALADEIKDKVDIIFSSPVLRAKQSADILQEKLQAELKTDDLLAEFNSGEWEGISKEELLKNKSYQDYKKLTSSEEKFNYKKGVTGDSYADLVEHIKQFIEKIAPVYAGKTILIVSHGVVSRAIQMIINDSGVDSFMEKDDINIGEKQDCYINKNGVGLDLHRPKIDHFEFKCEKCHSTMKRVPEVLDCWFESGSMPFAQFGNIPSLYLKRGEEERSDEGVNLVKPNFPFPADFIIEYTGQLRGWFYYLHVLSNALFDSECFKNVIVTGVLAGTDGRKMSKSYGNYPDPKETLEKYGSDALRIYFMNSPIMVGGDMSLNEQDIKNALRKNIMLVWNVYKFYNMYATEKIDLEKEPDSNNILDQWILKKLNQLLVQVTQNIEKYNLPMASRPITDFINDFSTWYLRRSRDRFKSSEDNQEDKELALKTTGYTLNILSKIIAPFMPFIAEQIWQNIFGYNFEDKDKSVHLESWPELNNEEEKPENYSIIENMEEVRKIVELGLAKRDELEIKVRQPLNKLTISNCQLEINKYEHLIKDELNVKNIILKEGQGELKVELDIILTPELIQEGIKRELVRFINALRKNSGLTIEDRVKIYFNTESDLIKETVKIYKENIMADVLALDIEEGGSEELEIQKKVKIGENEVELMLEKI